MLDLKQFLDGLADENHPFRKGPDLRQGSALPPEETMEKVWGPFRRDEAWRERQVRFYFMRINKN